jgi:hypothetical protein
MMRSTFSPAISPAFFRGGALRVVEVGRHGDDRGGDRLTQIGFGVRLELLQNHCRDFLWAIGLIYCRDIDGRVAFGVSDDLIGHALALLFHLVIASPHKALDGEDGVFGVDDGLALGGCADESLARLGEAHHRGAQPSTFRGGNHYRLATFQHSHDRVRCP